MSLLKITRGVVLVFVLITPSLNGNAEDVDIEHSDNPLYPIVEDDTVLHFTSKPPLYDIKEKGTTAWYPCVAEVVQSSNACSTPSAVSVRWVIPRNIPKLNHSGGDWPHLKGHGYFVDTDSNNTLVLVHPRVSDEGRYICEAELGSVSIKAEMQLHIIYFDRRSFLTRTAYGFLGVTLVGVGCGGLWLVFRCVIEPYMQKRSLRNKIAVPVIIEERILDETQPSLQSS